jgi:hypothetical protein
VNVGVSVVSAEACLGRLEVRLGGLGVRLCGFGARLGRIGARLGRIGARLGGFGVCACTRSASALPRYQDAFETAGGWPEAVDRGLGMGYTLSIDFKGSGVRIPH